MKTIGTYEKPEDAHLARMRLEAGGIPAYLMDENVVQTFWYVSNMVGGVRLQVADEDEAEARALLKAEGGVLPDAVEICCPYCGSDQVKRSELPRRMTYLSILFLNFPLPFRQKLYNCTACGKRWNEARRPIVH